MNGADWESLDKQLKLKYSVSARDCVFCPVRRTNSGEVVFHGDPPCQKRGSPNPHWRPALPIWQAKADTARFLGFGYKDGEIRQADSICRRSLHGDFLGLELPVCVVFRKKLIM
jgi:hypothetical protein